MATRAIRWLDTLNRKERYHLIRALTGGPFPVSAQFRKQLQAALGQRYSKKYGDLPQSFPFVAMDYHLDWVYAWVRIITESEKEPGEIRAADSLNTYERGGRGGKNPLVGSNQDVDLLIAYPDPKNPNTTHAVFLEAKGDTDWNPKQFKEKAERLNLIFGPEGDKRLPDVVPHFVLVGPSKDGINRLHPQDAPKWFFQEMDNGGHRDLKNLPFIKIRPFRKLFKVQRDRRSLIDDDKYLKFEVIDARLFSIDESELENGGES